MRFERDMPELPVLFASVVPERIPFENTFSANDSVAANTVRGLVGSLQASGSIARMDRPMAETVLGTLDEVMARAKPFFAAAHVRAKLKDAVVVHYARHHEVMWSTYVDWLLPLPLRRPGDEGARQRHRSPRNGQCERRGRRLRRSRAQEPLQRDGRRR